MRIHPDESAKERFAQAYEEYADAIFRHCYFHTFKREEAQEIMQETFMKTWEYIASGREIEQVRPFLYRTATNLFINASKKKREQSLDELQEAGFDPGEKPEWQGRDVIQEARVMKVLKKIDEPYRQAVMLRYIDDLSPAEIAEILQETPNVVSVRIHRGLKQLRSLLATHG
jgi:RNA polymerase sigma-70 factor, ECF subfamily